MLEEVVKLPMALVWLGPKFHRSTYRAQIGNSTLKWAFQMGLGILYCKAQSTAHLGLNELCPCLNYMTLWATTFMDEVGLHCFPC